MGKNKSGKVLNKRKPENSGNADENEEIVKRQKKGNGGTDQPSNSKGKQTSKPENSGESTVRRVLIKPKLACNNNAVPSRILTSTKRHFDRKLTATRKIGTRSTTTNLTDDDSVISFKKGNEISLNIDNNATQIPVSFTADQEIDHDGIEVTVRESEDEFLNDNGTENSSSDESEEDKIVWTAKKLKTLKSDPQF